MEYDNPKMFGTQQGNWLLRDLSFVLESLGGIPATKHPESATSLDELMDDCGNTRGGSRVEEEVHWPMGRYTLELAQTLFGAVMPTASFYTGWPAESYDMIEVGCLLGKRMSQARIKFMLDAIHEKIDRGDKIEKIDPEEAWTTEEEEKRKA
jgi:hypothetical protein